MDDPFKEAKPPLQPADIVRKNQDELFALDNDYWHAERNAGRADGTVVARQAILGRAVSEASAARADAALAKVKLDRRTREVQVGILGTAENSGPGKLLAALIDSKYPLAGEGERITNLISSFRETLVGKVGIPIGVNHGAENGYTLGLSTGEDIKLDRPDVDPDSTSFKAGFRLLIPMSNAIFVPDHNSFHSAAWRYYSDFGTRYVEMNADVTEMDIEGPGEAIENDFFMPDGEKPRIITPATFMHTQNPITNYFSYQYLASEQTESRGGPVNALAAGVLLGLPVVEHIPGNYSDAAITEFLGSAFIESTKMDISGNVNSRSFNDRLSHALLEADSWKLIQHPRVMAFGNISIEEIDTVIETEVRATRGRVPNRDDDEITELLKRNYRTRYAA